MNRIRMLSHREPDFTAFPAAMLSFTNRGMTTDTAPLPEPLTLTSCSTITAEMLRVVLCYQRRLG